MTATGAVSGALRTFSAVVEATSTTEAVAAAATEVVFSTAEALLGPAELEDDAEATGGLGEALAFFLFLSSPGNRCKLQHAAKRYRKSRHTCHNGALHVVYNFFALFQVFRVV